MANENKEYMVTYEVAGEKLTLSPSMVMRYVYSGDAQITEQEMMMFISLCKYQRLNPFIKEAYLIKYSNKNPATMVVGKDVFLKRADSTPNYAGKEDGIIVLKTDGTIEERQGEFSLPEEKIVGGWARVYYKNGNKPYYTSVSFGEYAAKKNDGTLNQQWATKPGTMIRKVAVVHALRESFPHEFSGMYDEAEMSKTTIDIESQVKEVINENANAQEFEIADFKEVDE